MNNVPFPWWDKTVTIFNKYVDPTTQRVTWYKTVVKNCFWKASNDIYNMGRYGMSTVGIQLETKTITCRIPKDKRYVDKRKWSELSNKNGKFTLANGDILVLGNVDDVIDDYTAGQRSTDLLSKYKVYDECLEIDRYSDNVRTGIALEHYRITGK